MKLINAQTLSIEDFIFGDSQLPKYAILSHTWGEGEVTFQEFTNPDETIRSSKRGFSKIQKTCELALQSGLTHVWVDTCCIDKTSSAELSEAINSMFQWYRESAVCYTWLSDLPASDANLSQLSDCRWFTRGWTLQELLAPRRLEFYDEAWTFRGTKEDLTPPLADITRISSEVLRDPEVMLQLPVAQRMSWAATRQTTRIEDMAYSLMGIFDVNMPMLYGEGHRAFQRLQEEIAKETNDLSMFAWRAEERDDADEAQQFHGIFASSPREFKTCAAVKQVQDLSFNPDYRISNKGLTLAADLHETPGGEKLFNLRCTLPTESGEQEEVGIWVKAHGGERFSRVRVTEVSSIKASGATSKLAHIHLFKRMNAALSRSLEGEHTGGIVMREGFNEAGKEPRYPEFPFMTMGIMPATDWDAAKSMVLTRGRTSYSVSANLSERPDKMEELGLGPNGMVTLTLGKLEGDDEQPFAMLLTNTAEAGIRDPLTGQFYKDKVRELLPTANKITMRKFMKDKGGTTLEVEVSEGVMEGAPVYYVDMKARHATREEVKATPEF